MSEVEPVVDRGDNLDGTIGNEAAVAAAAATAAAKLAADATAAAEIARLAEEKKDEDEEDGKDDDDAKKPREKRIPLSRHKEMLERERADRGRLEAKLAQYERGDDVAATNAALTKAENDLLAFEGQHAAMTADGKVAEAAKLMGDIRRLERAINTQQITLASSAAEARAYERARYDVTLERIETAYPALNPDLVDTFDAAMATKVMRIAKAYQLDGLTPSRAVQEAVKDLLGEPATTKQSTAVETKARVDADDIKDAKTAERKEAATRAAAVAAGASPASLAKIGADSDKLGGSLRGTNVMEMTQDAFAALDEATLAVLRGDVLA